MPQFTVPRIHKLSYWKLHFGTDILVASWCLIISTFFFLMIPINYFYSYDDTSLMDDIYYSTLLASGTCYFFGNFYFLSISYPDAMDNLLITAMTQDIEKLSWMEKYFIGNNLLIMTWFFALALVPVVIYYAIAWINGEVSAVYSVLVLIGFIISSTSSFFWIISCFPASMVMNNGRGSSYFLDFLRSNHLTCRSKKFWSKHFCSDFLVGSWFFFFTSLFSVIPATIDLALYDQNIEIICYFLSTCFMVVGSGLMVHASYPGNFQSDLTWRLMTCKWNDLSSDSNRSKERNESSPLLLDPSDLIPLEEDDMEQPDLEEALFDEYSELSESVDKSDFVEI